MKNVTILTLMAVFALLFTAGQAIAEGTTAGTPITNQASVTYSVSGVQQTAIESSPTGNSTPGNGADTTFTVDQKIDLLVTTLNGSAVSIAPGGSAATSFTVKNEGNDTQDILLSGIALPNTTANPFGGGLTDNFNSTVAVVFYEEDGTSAGFDATEDTPVTYLDEMTNGETRTVYMVITAAGTQVQNDLAVYALKGTALAGGGVGAQGSGLTPDAGGNTINGAAEIVFADSAGSDDTTGNYDGEHSARSAYVVSTATLTVTKVVAVYDDGVAPQEPWEIYPIPGAVMTYSITVANAATGQTATGVTLVDAIPAGTAFYVASGPTGGDGSGTEYEYSNQAPFNPAAPTWTDAPAADGNGVDLGVTAIKIQLPDIAAGTSETATFKVKIQ